MSRTLIPDCFCFLIVSIWSRDIFGLDGRPSVFPFFLALIKPAIVLSLWLLISISAKKPDNLQKNSPICVCVLILSVTDSI